ncbi:AAA family ATPase [Modestobacter sp. SYSU DS0290]
MTAAQAVPLRLQQFLDRLDGVTGWYPQWSARCPAHSDQHASLSVGVGDDGLAVVTCHGGADGGCDWSALRPALLARRVPEKVVRGSNPPAPASGDQRPEQTRPLASRRRQSRRLVAVPDQDAVDRFVWAISEEQIQDVSQWRGIGEATLIQADLGYDAHRERYTLPIRDLRTGELVDVEFCPATGSHRKWLQRPGGRGRLFAPLGLRDDIRVVLCEGEWDALVAAERGFNAVATTGGAGQPPAAELLEPLRGREVVIAFDCDDSGRAGAVKLATALAAVGCRVAVADLGLADKEDISDFFVKYGKTAADFAAALDRADPWVEQATDEEAEQLPGGIQSVDWADFWATEPTPIRYLVDPLIADGEVTRVYAQAKVGKSLLMLECAAGLATGRGALGKVTGESVSVVYVDQENTPDDWRTRLSDMGYGPDDDWSSLHWFSLQSWPPLDTAAGGAELLRVVQERGARLVVLDTQSKLLEGEEDKSFTGAAFYRHTLLPLKRLGVAVVVIDHAGKDGSSPRGSSTKQDDVDTIWRVEKAGSGRVRLVRTHGRKRHAVDDLRLVREADPLRHIPQRPSQPAPVSGGDLASSATHLDEKVRDCVAAFHGLEPAIDPAKTSQRQALDRLRADGFKCRAADARAAWKVFVAEANQS